MKKIFLLCLTLALFLLLTVSCALADSFTLMMYMCGSNLQEDCVSDMQEMLRAKTGGNVNIVALAGGATSWPDKRLSANRLNLFTISGGKFSATTDWGKSNMGSPDTLQKFMTYAMDTYPADKYMLVFWNHGGGTENGVCFDDVYDGDSLSLAEIEHVFYNLYQSRGLYLDIVGFDACLMAGYEAAAMLSPYAGYMVASEELEPGLGWYYTDWLAALRDNPAMRTSDICKNIVAAYQEACEDYDEDDYYTLSVIDLSMMPQLIGQMEKLSAYLADALENRQLSTISRMRQRVRSYGDWSDSSSDMIDLSSLLDICEQFAPNATAAARRALKNAVLVNYKSYMVDVANGMSIYVPMDTRSSIRSIMQGYSIGAIPNYIDFVQGYAALLNGSNYSFGSATPTSMDANTMSGPAFTASLAAFGFIPGASYSAESASDAQPAPAATPTAAPAQQSSSSGGFFGSSVQAPTAAPAQQSSSSGGFFGSSVQAPTATPAQQSSSSGGFFGSSVQAPTATPAQQSSSSGGFFGSSVQAPTAAPAQQSSPSGGFFGFIAGSAAAQVPVVTQDSLGFSLALSQNDIDNLSYAEGALFMDLSDEDGVFLVDLGYLQNSWIDWQNRTVYSLFDGSWPTLGDQLVVMYDQSRTEASRRSIIPVRVNGEETYLVVVFNGDSSTGRIIGCNAGFDDNGLPIRTTTPLADGDEIVPIFTMYYCDWDDLDNDNDMEEVEFDGDPIIWKTGMTVTYESLEDEEDPTDYQFGFYLNDIFGDYQLSDLITFTL